MSINLITGYDISKDEYGNCRNTESNCTREVFGQYAEILRSKTLSSRPSPLADESKTEWLYTQKH